MGVFWAACSLSQWPGLTDRHAVPHAVAVDAVRTVQDQMITQLRLALGFDPGETSIDTWNRLCDYARAMAEEIEIPE